MNTLVDVFVIGVQKAATTSLYDFLSTYDEIGLSKNKETKYFYNDFLYDKGFSYFHSQFQDVINAKVLIDIDPDYIYSERAIKRIKSYNPYAKCIVLLRDPAKRAYSHYLMTKRRGLEKRAFQDAFIIDADKGYTEENDHYSYYSRSRYDLQLETIYNLFERRNVLLINSEKFVSEVEERVKILSFLGITTINNLHLPRKNVAKVAKFEFLSYILHYHNWIKSDKARESARLFLSTFTPFRNFLINIRNSNMDEGNLQNISKEDYMFARNYLHIVYAYIDSETELSQDWKY